MWRCKGCPSVLPSRSQVLKHYRVKHRYYGNNNHFPCAYETCPCTFRTWNALLIHLNRFHVTETTTQSGSCVFSCHLCLCKDLVSTVPLGLLKEEVAQSFKQRYPDLSEI